MHNKNIKSRTTKVSLKTNINRHNKNTKVMEYIDEEINDISYNLAIQSDKRTFCQYYISLVKTKHNLMFALLNNTDYNSIMIKIDLFFIGFSIDYIINALFYTDDTMHKIYKSKGMFDLKTQLPIIVYSTLIIYILNTPLNFLALSNDAILSFKQDKTKNNIMKRAKSLGKILTIKFVFYFIIGFLLLLFFWYYISMFCVIYKNTQTHLIKDTLMSFCLSFFLPFGTYLIFGALRIYSLSNINNKRECLYKFNNYLQSF